MHNDGVDEAGDDDRVAEVRTELCTLGDGAGDDGGSGGSKDVLEEPQGHRVPVVAGESRPVAVKGKATAMGVGSGWSVCILHATHPPQPTARKAPGPVEAVPIKELPAAAPLSPYATPMPHPHQMMAPGPSEAAAFAPRGLGRRWEMMLGAEGALPRWGRGASRRADAGVEQVFEQDVLGVLGSDGARLEEREAALQPRGRED